MPKICGITTQAATIAAFMLKPFNYAASKGFSCFAISSPDTIGRLTPEALGNVKHIPIKIKWGYMNPIQVLSTVFKLYKVFKREKFDIIQYATMNAALCASIAGWLARVPIRINLLWGLDYQMFSGLKRALYYSSTKLICRLSTHVQPDSKGNLKFGIEIGLFDEKKGSIIYNGSACGLDLNKFDISKKEEWRDEVYNELSLDKYKTIFGFVGAISFDKGMNELLQSFMRLACDDAALILIGEPKKIHGLDTDVYSKAQERPNIYFLGRKNNPEKYFASFDFNLLPSYAEGFGMVVLEAAGLGVPSIISDIKGPSDFIKDNVNGFVCKVKSVNSLTNVLQKACTISKERYNVLSQNAYEIVKRDYDSKVFWNKFTENRISLYKSIQKQY